MYLRRLKFAFVSSAFVFLWLGFGIQSPSDDAYVASIVNYVYAQDPGCTNEDCPPDPGCTNEDCPPDPGCTNEDCPPAYTEDCCCYEQYVPEDDQLQRLCCCKAGRNVACRLSKVIGENEHEPLMPDMIIQMGQIPGISKGMCAPAWFVDSLRDPWWPLGEGCGWWNQIQKCGLLGY